MPVKCYVEVRDEAGNQMFGLAIDHAAHCLWPGEDEKSTVIAALETALIALKGPERETGHGQMSD